MSSTKIMESIFQLVKELRAKKKMLSTAESCTGGLLSGYITAVPGASQIFERGFVTYSNNAKIELLTVPTYFIEDYGAVSMQTAIAMAEGAILNSKADISVAITGTAGPEGGTAEKPVGTVFIATAERGGKSVATKYWFDGTRESVREQAMAAAVQMVRERVGS